MNYTGQLETEYGKIRYKVENQYVSIVEYTGRDLLVEIPDNICDLPVRIIKKKAFLSQKFVKTVKIPQSIESIEDYAFARCRKLEKVYIPYKKIKFGIDVFKDCDSLSYFYDIDDKINMNEDIAFLLAKTLNELDAFFLFDLENVGSDEWINHLDATIAQRLAKDDMEDFAKMILCGEEEVVCGEDGTIEDSNPEHYKSNRVKEKVRISFLRLLHNYKINSNLESILINYLLDHVKGCVTDETWQVVLNEHGEDKEYYDYLLEIGGINSDNFDSILKDMGNRHTEIKSYLIKYNDENSTTDDVFADFEL